MEKKRYVEDAWVSNTFWTILGQMKKNTKKCDRGSVDRNSVDRNCVLSLDRNYVNHLTELLDVFQLIETFNNDFSQTPKNWSVDRNFY